MPCVSGSVNALTDGRPALAGRFAALAAIALIALHLALGLWCARRMSVTYDEFAHLPAGAAYWRYGALSIYDLSPPLPRYLAAAAIAWRHDVVVPPPEAFVAMPTATRHWVYGDAFMRANAANYQGVFLPARAVMTLLSCVGAAIVFAWTRRLARSDAAGLLACAMYATCPNVVAQASIVGTDLASAIALLIVAWQFDWYVRSPTRVRGGIVTALLALAPMVKFSLLTAWPIAAVLLTLAAARRAIGWRAALVPLAALPFAAFAACWLTYAGQPAGASLAALEANTSPQMRWLDQHGLGAVATAFPRPLIEGFDRQLFEAAGQFDGYLFGREFAGAIWGYYPVAALSKWTLGTGGGGGFGRGLMPGAHPGAAAAAAAVPAAFAIGYAVLFTMTTDIDVGVRYLLPMLPLLFGAAAVTIWRSGGRRVRRAGIALAALASVEGIASMPDPTAFYNLAARATGVAGRGYIDEDAGQGLIVLREWMAANGVERVRLAYSCCVDPGVYGIAFDEFDDPRSRAGWLVMGGGLAGLRPANLAVPGGGTRALMLNPAIGERMRSEPPDARVGPFYVYALPPVAR